MDDRVADFLSVMKISSGKIKKEKQKVNKIRVLHVRHIDYNWKIDTNCDSRDGMNSINQLNGVSAWTLFDVVGCTTIPNRNQLQILLLIESSPSFSDGFLSCVSSTQF